MKFTQGEVDPATVPELVEILRHGWEAKVRMFDVACSKYHRLVEVLEVNRRPLVKGIDTTFFHAAPGNPERRWRWVPSTDGYVRDRRGRLLCLWLDLPDEVVTAVEGPRVMDRYTFTCAKGHCSEQIPLQWLRGLVESGQRRRVIIDDNMRYATREMPGG